MRKLKNDGIEWNEWMKSWTEWANQMNECMNVCTYEWTNENHNWMKWMNATNDERMNVWMYVCLDDWLTDWLNEWMEWAGVEWNGTEWNEWNEMKLSEPNECHEWMNQLNGVWRNEMK